MRKKKPRPRKIEKHHVYKITGRQDAPDTTASVPFNGKAIRSTSTMYVAFSRQLGKKRVEELKVLARNSVYNVKNVRVTYVGHVEK